MSIATAPARAATGKRSHIAVVASLAAAALLLANAVVAAIAPDQMSDHSTGAGRLSEGLVGFSFVAGAIALAALLPRGILARIFWVLGIAGLAASGATMIAVVVSTVEAPFELFLAEVAITVPALIGVGAIGIKRRVWPWWVGVGSTRSRHPSSPWSLSRRQSTRSIGGFVAGSTVPCMGTETTPEPCSPNSPANWPQLPSQPLSSRTPLPV